MNHSVFDGPLNSVGRSQLQEVVLPEKIDAIYCGCDTRALQTAELLQSRLNLPPSASFAKEGLRPLINPHCHTYRSSLSVLKKLFPTISFDPGNS